MMDEGDKIPSLGRLSAVELREVWPSEPYSFTPWLAQAENLQFLAEAIGLPGLELIATERQVDIFAADIVAKAADTGETVLVENQIERSDHTHLGQILTYAAGLEAAIIVWIARRFTDGHRAAIDWMNRITTPDFAFFAVEVEALRIGDSVPAPRFTVVSRPNDWARSLRAVSHSPEADRLGSEFQRYWDGYHKMAIQFGAPFRVAAKQVRSPNYYAQTDVKSVYFSAWRATSARTIGVYLSMFGEQSAKVFAYLSTSRKDIDHAFGSPLEWQTRKEGSTYWILAGKLDVSLDESDWPRQHEWLAKTMKRLADAVAPALDSLPPDEGTE